MKNGTALNGRILWFDGDSSFTMDGMYEYILSGKELHSGVFVKEETAEVAEFNRLNPKSAVEVKCEMKPLSKEWLLPDQYKNLNVSKYINSMLLKEIDSNEDFDEFDIEDRMDRVQTELTLFSRYGMEDILRTVIYIVATFKENKVIWGTGRGSSCCSYCLYLIQLHDVDSVKFDLDLTEFFR